MRGKPGTFKDLSGMKFGMLTALSSFMRGRRRFWICECQCGKQAFVSVDRMQSGKTKSCGCKVFIRPFESLYNNFVYKSQRVRAGRRKHTNEITYEQFLEFTQETKCHYCWAPLTWTKHGIAKGSSYLLDRKDNSLGYSVENCVACCTQCNRAKNEVYTYEDWFGMTQWQRSRVQAKEQ